ncbi:hypothetical protein K435DRAFT_779867 [Dendrothele bispora CBS 962.96]|uniref:Uncharacterized protein n=1 Tax=Dendrothele bispora (strain CBS 962.96) TaxID=1314807 RepID=A0A4S8LW70_DENBC|nr:hypothetical protein K435DRAFT_779867 [Dendrothele bispora CBS 962.96]
MFTAALQSSPDCSLDRRLALSILTVDNVQWQLATSTAYLCHPAYPPLLHTLPF